MSFLSNIALQITNVAFSNDVEDIVDVNDVISGAISLAIAGLAVFLTVLTYTTYKKTKYSKLKFIAVAFSLFTVFLLMESIQEFLPLSDDLFDIESSLIILGILICFFLGIFGKQSQNHN